MNTESKNLLNQEERLTAASMFLMGTSKEAIRARFSDNAAELDALFAELSLLNTGVDSPEESVLASVLTKIEPAVTALPEARYKEEASGSLIARFIRSMSAWKSGLVFAALVILVGGGYLINGDSPSGTDIALRQESAGDSTSFKSMAPMSASEDSSLESLDGEADEEASLDNEYDSDMALVTSDAPQMNDYTNYNEKEL